ncbi:MAG: hypothetical protein IKN34_04985 [Treponema sp.]|nr:hypothetical protein [Treponema sp.]
METTEKDEILKKKIIEEAAKNGCTVVCVFDDDVNHKNRRNTKRTLILLDIIHENEFSYCHFSEQKSKIETVNYYAVFGNPENTKAIIEKERWQFRALKFYDDIESVIDGKKFYHPKTDKEYDKFEERHEFHIDKDALALIPQYVGQWEYDIKSNIYRAGQLLCSIRYPTEENPEYSVAIGTVVPIGVTMKKFTAKTLEEAHEGMKNWKRK